MKKTHVSFRIPPHLANRLSVLAALYDGTVTDLIYVAAGKRGIYSRRCTQPNGATDPEEQTPP